MPLDATAIVTVTEAKAQTNITGTADDAELELFINAASRKVDKMIGPVVNRTVTETVRGGPVLVLSQRPVVSLTSLTGVYGPSATYVVANLYLNKARGTLSNTYGSGAFTPLLLDVVYVAGRAATASAVEADIKLATLIIVEHLWQTQRGAGTPAALFAGAEEAADFAPGFGFAIPNRARDLLSDYMLHDVVA